MRRQPDWACDQRPGCRHPLPTAPRASPEKLQKTPWVFQGVAESVYHLASHFRVLYFQVSQVLVFHQNSDDAFTHHERAHTLKAEEASGGSYHSVLRAHQPWTLSGRMDAEAEAPVLWPPDVKSWLLGKDPDAGKEKRREEKGETEDEMAGWHHWLDGHEFEQALGDGEGQGALVCCSPWGCKYTTERLNNNKHFICFCYSNCSSFEFSEFVQFVLFLWDCLVVSEQLVTLILNNVLDLSCIFPVPLLESFICPWNPASFTAEWYYTSKTKFKFAPAPGMFLFQAFLAGREM